MNKPKRSISYKIWKNMVITIGLFLLAVVVINATVIDGFKKDLYYNQLEDAAKAKSANRSIDEKISKDKDKEKGEEVELNSSTINEETILITHFGVFFEEDQKILHIDSFTRFMYPGPEGTELIESISEDINVSTMDDKKAKVKIDDSTFLYYVDWVEPGKNAIVFFAPEKESDKSFIFILLIFIGIMLISFITSKIVASRIVKPIRELELFAEEVAMRNWNAIVPDTEADEIGLLAKSLENMRDSLKIAEERDREFLQSTSHDLKTPVMIIKGYAQALIDGVEIDSKTSAANVIKIESERLERRISQLLQLNTIGHTLENLGDRDIVRIDRILKSLVNHCKVISPNILWNVELIPLEIKGNAESLLVAFENIMDNQMRYATSSIDINMKLVDKKTHIIIHNDGPEFTLDDPMILFDSYKKDLEGKFGLGLTIVHKVIKSHQGVIIAYNSNNGVSFEIVF